MSTPAQATDEALTQLGIPLARTNKRGKLNRSSVAHRISNLAPGEWIGIKPRQRSSAYQTAGRAGARIVTRSGFGGWTRLYHLPDEPEDE